MNSLTIVIPTTGRDTLDRAIASAESAADEVIVVADGWKGPATIHGEFGAPGLARNAAMWDVQTTHVGFLDDDDVLVGEVYRRVTLDVHPAAPMVIHTMWHPELGPVPRPGWPIELGNVGISFAMRTEVWRALGPFIPGPPFTMAEDFELVRRLMDRNLPIALSPEIAYIVRPEEHRWPSLTAT